MNDEPESYTISKEEAASELHKRGILIRGDDGLGEEWYYYDDPKLKAEYEKCPDEAPNCETTKQ